MRVMSDELSPMPTHVRVGPYRYTVITNPISMDQSNAACIQYGPLHISVSPNNAHDRKVEALLHEVFHAVWEVVFGRNHEIEPSYTCEDVIDRLSPHLLAVLRDNTDLVAYLTDSRDVP